MTVSGAHAATPGFARAGIALMLLGAVLAVFHTGDNLDWFAVSGGLLVLGTTCLAFSATWSQLRVRGPFLLLLAYWGWMALTAFLSAEAAFNATATLYLFGALPVGWLAVTLSPQPQRFWRYLAWLCVGMGLALVCWQLAQLFSGRAYMSGPMRNENSLGGLLLLQLFVGAGFLLPRCQPRHHVAWGGVLLWISAMALGLGLTGSRAIPLILAGAIAVTVVALRASQRGRLAALAGAVVLGLVLAQLLDPREMDYLSRTVATVGNPATEGAPRLAIWRATLDMLADHWMWGIGPGLFWLVYPRYRLPADRSGGLYAHNDYLQAFVETGVVGGVLFLVWIAALGWMAWRVFRGPLADDRRFELAGIAGGVSSVLAFSLLTFNFYILPTLVFMGLALGCFDRLSASRDDRVGVSLPVSAPLSSRTGRVVVLLLALFPLTFLVRVGWAYHNVTQAKAEAAVGNLLPADRHLARAMDLVPSQALPRMFRAQLMGEALRQPGDLTPAQQRRILQDALSWLKAAHERNPLRSEVYHVHAELLAHHRELLPASSRPSAEGVAEIYQAGLARNPLNFRLRMDYARFLARHRDVEVVANLLEDGLKYGYPAWPAVIDYYRLTARFLERTDRETALAEVRDRIEGAVDLYEARKARDRMMPEWARPFVEHL